MGERQFTDCSQQDHEQATEYNAWINGESYITNARQRFEMCDPASIMGRKCGKETLDQHHQTNYNVY